MSEKIDNNMFNEIVSSPRLEMIQRPPYVEVYALRVQPEHCGRLVKWLSNELPLSMDSLLKRETMSPTRSHLLSDLSHLKRVRKTEVKSSSINRTVVQTDEDIYEEVIDASNSETRKLHESKRLKRSSDLSTNCSSEIKDKELCQPVKSESRQNGEVCLQVVLGLVEWLDLNDSDTINGKGEPMADADSKTKLDVILEKINELLPAISRRGKMQQETSISCKEEANRLPCELGKSVVTKEMVSARLASSESEWQEFNKLWPVHYFPNKMVDEEKQQLSAAEHDQMVLGMKAAIEDAMIGSTHNIHGAVVIDPLTSKIISRSSTEIVAQQKLWDRQQSCSTLNHKSALGSQNPLVSAIVLACQGVSRIERQNASGNGMGSDIFQKGQYLCTGYDVYTTVEPTTFEAMALVHSRINRLIFGLPVDWKSSRTPHASGIVHMQVHSLPGTNHKYRAFMCKRHSEVWELCRQSQTFVENERS